jgi:predicted DNA-binding transcriptional regulator AlpA
VTGRLLTTRELAQYLGLSTESVLRRWRRGDIPGGIRLASNVLQFRESAIDHWLAELEAAFANDVARFAGTSVAMLETRYHHLLSTSTEAARRRLDAFADRSGQEWATQASSDPSSER